MFGSSFLLPLFAIWLSCLCPASVVSAFPRPSCITFFFANGDAQSPPTRTVFRSTSTSTSTLPCGSCKLETQAFFPYPFYGYAAIDEAFTTTVTSALGTSTSFVCAPLTSSTKKGIDPPGTRPTGATDPASKSRNTANTRGPVVTGTANGPFTASGFRPSFIMDPSRGRSSNGTAILGSITATRVSILTLPRSIKKNATSLRPLASSGIVKQKTCTKIDPAAPTADCITLSFISGNFTSCTSCPTDPADLSLCPFLCSIPFRGGPILQCSSTNLEGNSDIPRFAAASCQRCLPACDVTSITGRPYYLPSSSLVSRLPSSSLLVSRLPSQSLVSRSPSTSQSSRRLLNPSIISLSALKATLTTSITSSRTSSSSGADPTSSCPLVPAVVDHGDPCQIDFSDNLLCSACPTLFEVNVFTCPFLCQIPFSEGLSALQCSQYDLTGQNLLSSFNGTVQSCQKCLTDCPAPTFIFSRPAVTSIAVRSSTSTSVASTCTAVGASVTSSPFLITSDEILYRESCGTSQAQVDACPFLCSGSRAQLFSRCAKTDESGTVFENLVQLCEPCLPPCEANRRT